MGGLASKSHGSSSSSNSGAGGAHGAGLNRGGEPLADTVLGDNAGGLGVSSSSGFPQRSESHTLSPATPLLLRGAPAGGAVHRGGVDVT